MSFQWRHPTKEILPQELQKGSPEIPSGVTQQRFCPPEGHSQLLLPQPNNFCLKEGGWQILPLHPHLLSSHNHSSEEWKKTYLICKWAEGTSQEVNTCSCQMEWFMKLLSLSKNRENARASSLQCKGKQLRSKMFKSLSTWISLALFWNLGRSIAALSCTVQAGAVTCSWGMTDRWGTMSPSRIPTWPRRNLSVCINWVLNRTEGTWLAGPRTS